MKALSGALLYVGMVALFVAGPVMAQEKQVKNASVLERKIEELETMNLASKAPDVQTIYKRMLLKRYNEYVEALQQELNDFKALQAQADDSDAATRNELATKIQQRLDKQSFTNEKIQILSGDLRASVDSSSASPAPTTSQSASSPQTRLKPAVYTVTGSSSLTLKPTESGNGIESVPTTDSMARKPPAPYFPAQQIVIPTPTLDTPISDSDKEITGKGANGGGAVEIAIDDPTFAAQMVSVPAAADGTFVLAKAHYPVALAAGQRLYARQKIGAEYSLGSIAVKVIEKKKADVQEALAADDYKAQGAVALAIGGSVISNQAQKFSQADPFFGFIAGYTSKDKLVRGSQKKNADGTLVVDANSKPVYNLKNWGTFNLRFEGLFESAPRTATAPAATASPSPTPAPTPSLPNTDLPFLASRKTFDTNVQLWWEFPFPGSEGLWTIGPFVSMGTSSVLDKNELKNDETTVKVSDPTTKTDVALDTTQAKTDNDLKRYFEYGLMLNVYLKSRGLFLQSTFTKGNWESFDGLYPGTVATATTPAIGAYNTKNRFHGFLKVFPMGLARGFNKTPLTPVFGVDLNASRGPDSLRFFSGFVIKLSGISDKAKADEKK